MHVSGAFERSTSTKFLQSSKSRISIIVHADSRRKLDVQVTSHVLKELAGTEQPWKFEASKFGLDMYSIAKAEGSGSSGAAVSAPSTAVNAVRDSGGSVFGFKGSFVIPGNVETCAKVIRQWDRTAHRKSTSMARSIVKSNRLASLKLQMGSIDTTDAAALATAQTKAFEKIKLEDMMETVYHHFKLSWPYQDRDLCAKRCFVHESADCTVIVYAENSAEMPEDMLPDEAADRMPIFPS